MGNGIKYSPDAYFGSVCNLTGIPFPPTLYESRKNRYNDARVCHSTHYFNRIVDLTYTKLPVHTV